MLIIYALTSVAVFMTTRAVIDVFFTSESDLDIIERSLKDYQFIRKGEKERYAYYQFRTDRTKVQNVKEITKKLSENIGKPVRVFYDRVLTVRVYKNPLPRSILLDRVEDRIQIGIGLDGVVYHDFSKLPHMVVAGVTGYGKSTFIRSMMQQIPKKDVIVLIDLKNDGDYRKTSATTVEEAKKVLQFALSRTCKERVFVIIDEAAQLQKPSHLTRREAKVYFECLELVSKICSLGRSFGVHMIFATQYPHSDVIPKEVKQNSEARVVFRTVTEVASRVALDETGAEKLSYGVSGRCLYKTDRVVEVQTYHVKDEGDVNIYVNDSDREKKKKGNGDNWSVG